MANTACGQPFKHMAFALTMKTTAEPFAARLTCVAVQKSSSSPTLKKQLSGSSSPCTGADLKLDLLRLLPSLCPHLELERILNSTSYLFSPLFLLLLLTAQRGSQGPCRVPKKKDTPSYGHEKAYPRGRAQEQKEAAPTPRAKTV